MRIAAISDIHSNVYALEAVIDDMKHRDINITVNLGDILYGPIAPKATYDLLQQHNFITIRGNQDRQIYQASRQEIADNPTLDFIIRDLGQAPLTWMEALPFDYQLDNQVYLCHGTPTDDMVYLLESVDSGSAKLRTEHEIASLLAGQQSAVIFCGHTHTPRTVSIANQQLIINPGSVGLPAYIDSLPVPHYMQNDSPHANYCIAEKSAKGWTVQQIKVPYDINRAIEKANLQGREDWAHFLATGRANKN